MPRRTVRETTSAQAQRERILAAATVGYDPDSQDLHVRFLNSGETYVYYGVDEWVFDEFRQADSKGTYLNINIKNRYQYGKL
ncbi:MAG TPA: KTSC domain-containing protein [Woeseiaceae bacterium]|jgi:hypothetical protein|nr:KTSC domain-containing protein [Woeseiaceae bacterium]|tara:strand:- start:442 stop:687 length:246 start_codon:yes stop_codon:yes gene_type:complete